MSAKKATKNTQDNAAHGGCSGVTCSPSYYTFRNRDGQTIQLRGDLTMEDLVRMGYTNIGLAKPETPLKPHEWRAAPNECRHDGGHELNGVGMRICLGCRADISPENSQAQPPDRVG
jgi:hypothetical protein